MSTMMATLGVDKLTLEEQSQLLRELQQELAPDCAGNSPLTDAQRTELNRRIAHMEAHPEEWIPWDEFRESTLKKYEL